MRSIKPSDWGESWAEPLLSGKDTAFEYGKDAHTQFMLHACNAFLASNSPGGDYGATVGGAGNQKLESVIELLNLTDRLAFNRRTLKEPPPRSEGGLEFQIDTIDVRLSFTHHEFDDRGGANSAELTVLKRF